MIPQPPEPAETLGQRIARLRFKRGWTQQDLAERLAVSRVAVSHFEMGLAVPSERTVVLLAGLFKQEPQELVAGTSYPAAKADRLPSIACRYTEVELQLALLGRDLDWLGRSEGQALRREVITEWLARIEALSRNAYDQGELTMLGEARERLRQL
jgi:transcriptional regulator with XRE-family HTH domain